MWVGCVALLCVPRLRNNPWGSLFFPDNSPLGRGDIRARNAQHLMLFCALSVALLANVPIPAPVFRVAEVTFAVVALLSLIVALTQVFFNWPRFLAPKSMRTQRGAVGEWLHAAKRKAASSKATRRKRASR